MISASAILTSSATKRSGPALCEACARSGISLHLLTDVGGYRERFNDAANIITWGFKMPGWWYQGRGSNVLYMENGLLSQADGYYYDNCGWFSESGMVKEKRFLVEPKTEELRRVYSITKTLGGQPTAVTERTGPIMFAVQNTRDAGNRFHYPLCPKGEDAIEVSLRLLNQALGHEHVEVRPHPRFRPAWAEGWPRYKKYFGPHWTLNEEQDVYKELERCAALITVNSTLATECVAMGIPVATLGLGTFTGAGVTLDCSSEHMRVGDVRHWRAKPPNAERYLSAIVRQQLPFGDTEFMVDHLLGSAVFMKWVDCAHASWVK